MSWSEIKKAVNSKMSEMSLDEMFGWTWVTANTLTRRLNSKGEETASVSGFTGWLVVNFGGTSTGSTGVVLDTNNHMYGHLRDYNYEGYLHHIVIPVSKDVTYMIKLQVEGNTTSTTLCTLYYAVYAWGGGIS